MIWTQHISYEFFKKQTWACDHLKTSNLSGDNFKKVLYLDESTPAPAIRSGDTGQRIPCFDSCQLITTLMCNQFSPGLPKKLESVKVNIFFCGADGRSLGRSVGRCTVTWLPNFLGWVDLLSYGAPLRSNFISRNFTLAVPIFFQLLSCP